MLLAARWKSWGERMAPGSLKRLKPTAESTSCW
jgi:hypothetical protein